MAINSAEGSSASHTINPIEIYNVFGCPKFIFERLLPSRKFGESPVDVPMKGNKFGGRQPCIIYDNPN